MAAKIFLSRHGESEYMLKELLGGDSSLTAKGRAYALQLSGLILPRLAKDSAGSIEQVTVLTSTLQRTIQTAAHLPFQQRRVAALNEINAGICEHMTYKEVAIKYPAVHEARSKDKLGFRYPEGESYLDLVMRLWPLIHNLQQQQQAPVIIVAHQAVLRVVLGLLLRKPLTDIPTISIPLHTVMELSPATDGSYTVNLLKAVLPGAHGSQPPAKQTKPAPAEPTLAASAASTWAATAAVSCRRCSQEVSAEAAAALQPVSSRGTCVQEAARTMHAALGVQGWTAFSTDGQGGHLQPPRQEWQQA